MIINDSTENNRVSNKLLFTHYYFYQRRVFQIQLCKNALTLTGILLYRTHKSYNKL